MSVLMTLNIDTHLCPPYNQCSLCIKIKKENILFASKDDKIAVQSPDHCDEVRLLLLSSSLLRQLLVLPPLFFTCFLQELSFTLVALSARIFFILFSLYIFFPIFILLPLL